MRAELGIPEHAPVVGNVANFKAAKDHPTLLQAAARVRERVPEVRFLLIGQGPLEPETRRLAADLGLDGTVVFTGFRTDAHRLLAALDVFTLSSTYEGLPIALIEAMALGRPAVVTRVGGVPEVLHDGAQGLLVPPRDPAALADGLLRLLGDPGPAGPDGRRRAGPGRPTSTSARRCGAWSRSTPACSPEPCPTPSPAAGTTSPWAWPSAPPPSSPGWPPGPGGAPGVARSSPSSPAWPRPRPAGPRWPPPAVSRPPGRRAWPRSPPAPP